MKLKRRIKKTTKQYITVAAICIIIIGSAAIFTSLVITNQIHQEYQTLLDEAHQEIESNKKNVYVAIVDIASGEYITKEKVTKKTVFATQPEDTYLTSDEIGMVALVNIPTGTQMMKTMATDNIVSSEIRELEYDVINVSSNIVKQDTVDVRIGYPNGESYIVLSKKLLKGLEPDTAKCLLWLNEEELLKMSAAIVDAGLYPGSKLYVTKYIEPNIQEASVATYTPSISILTLIEQDPNIVDRCSKELAKKVRKSLENRLAYSMDLNVAEINWDVNSNLFIDNDTLTTDVVEDNSTIELEENSTISASSSVSEETSNYLYYAEEEQAKEGDMEYGE